VDEGRVTKRRIDLLGGSTAYLTAALPHELTHVVLKDRFASSVLPRWADEGMAILADSTAKQERHFKDLRLAIAHHTTYHAAELLQIEDYPPPSRFGVFYGESASLTNFLVARKGPAQFVRFLGAARGTSYDTALRECYDIANVGELDRQWRQSGYSVQSAFYESSVSAGRQSVPAGQITMASVSVSNRPSDE
jgi:hypothetical protein